MLWKWDWRQRAGKPLSKRITARALRVEWLEPRLALSHAPLGHVDARAPRHTPTPVVAAHKAPAADVSSHNVPKHEVSSHDDRTQHGHGVAAAEVQVPNDDCQSPPPVVVQGDAQGDTSPPVEGLVAVATQTAVASQAIIAPPIENDSPTPIVNALPPSVPAGHDAPIAAGNESVTSVDTIWVTIVEIAPARTGEQAENSPASVPSINVPNINVPSVNMPSVNPTIISLSNTSGPNSNLDSALAAVALSESDPNTPHANQPAISIAAAPTETSNATVALAGAQFCAPWTGSSVVSKRPRRCRFSFLPARNGRQRPCPLSRAITSNSPAEMRFLQDQSPWLHALGQFRRRRARH